VFSWFTVAIVAFFVATLEFVLRANLARRGLENTAFVVLLAAFGLFVLAWLVFLWRAFRRPP
jgi:hypothetical protein